MIYDLAKKGINIAALCTPNTLIPKLGEAATCGKLKYYVWAEVYLIARFLFACYLAFYAPTISTYLIIVLIIQTGSIIYLLKIVFPVTKRNLRDPGRSLFFALGHYVEIGLSMSFIYRGWGCFNSSNIGHVDSIYYSFVTMTTLGYGDITPADDLTKIMATFQTLIGMFMFAIVIGLFLSLSSNDRE